MVVLKGNLCENGAVIKPSAASPHLMQHTGKAVVFETIDDYKARIDDPGLEVDEHSVLVLKNVGLKGFVHYLSQFMTLEAGDLITTGTPPGVGLGMKPPQYLKAGDVVELAVEGLGRQKQVCVNA